MTVSPTALQALLDSEIEQWLEELASQDIFKRLLALDPAGRLNAGYGHTLVEICQQPLTWIDTSRRIAEAGDRLRERMHGTQWVVFTGSGSSQYAGDCAHPVLCGDLGVPAFTLGGGWLLMEGLRSVPTARPGLLVSLARSGDSPESAGAVSLFLNGDPGIRHLIITCNAKGRLATECGNDPRVTVLPLDPHTHDRSLVMTSSYTNMVIASRSLGLLHTPGAIETLAARLSAAAKHLLAQHTATLAGLARGRFSRAVYLASGCRFGAAKESALKMLEMNAGRIPTLAETYLSLRHGPMCLIDNETLVVCSLSSDRLARAYEEDLIRELNKKQLGARKLIVGERISPCLLAEHDVAVEVPGMAAIGDDSVPVLDVMVGQLLAFFRCMAGGLRPDMPSTGVINRVVNEFTVHSAEPAGEPDVRARG